MMSPVEVRLAAVSSLAMPKSITFTWPEGSTMMFAGFTSRWTTWFACARSSAEATCPSRRIVSGRSRRPRARSLDWSVSPSTSSMTMRLVAPVATMSWTVTMFGWRSLAATCASRTKRCLTSSSWAGSAKASSRMRLTATSRPRIASRARNTSPNAPEPRRATGWYRSPGRPVRVIVPGGLGMASSGRSSASGGIRASYAGPGGAVNDGAGCGSMGR